MAFDKNPKKPRKTRNPKKPRKQTMTNIPTNTVSSNISIPKNKFGVPTRYNSLFAHTPVAYPDDGTFSPIPPDFSYTFEFPIHFSESDLDWGEPSFGFGMVPSEDDEPQNVSAKQNNPPLQLVDDANNGISNQPNLNNNPIPNNKKSQKKPANPRKKVAPIPTPASAPVPAPLSITDPTPMPATFSVSAPAPKRATSRRSSNNRYQYKSLQDAFYVWLNGLDITNKSKGSYRQLLLNFIKMLDEEGTYVVHPNVIENYGDELFEQDHFNTSKHFKSIAKAFFKWILAGRIYNKIKPHATAGENDPTNQSVADNSTPEPQIDEATKFVSKTLSDLFNMWSNTLKNDFNTNVMYKMQMSKFMVFLIKLKTLNPAVDSIKEYIEDYSKYQNPSNIENCKKAIKSFLQFLEQMAIPQDPRIYKFLDSN